MQQALVEQHLHQGHRAANLHEARHDVLAAGLQVRQHRHALAHARPVVDRQLHAGAVRHRDQVHHGVGGAAHRHVQAHRVLEGLLRQDVPGADAAPDQLQHRATGLLAVHGLVPGHGGLRRRVREAQAKRLDGRRHGVGGVHAAARARAGDGDLGHGLDVRLAALAGRLLAHGLEDVHQVHVPPLVLARQDRAAIHEDRRPVQPRHRHHAARHVLVAPANRHEAVKPLAAHDRLDRVGDDLARHQGVLHPLRSHRDAVGDRDGVEDDRLAAGLVDPLRHAHRELVDVHVARRDHGPRRGHPHLRLLEVLLLEARRVQHPAARRPLDAIHHLRRIHAFQRLALRLLLHELRETFPKPRPGANPVFKPMRAGSGERRAGSEGRGHWARPGRSCYLLRAWGGRPRGRRERPGRRRVTARPRTPCRPCPCRA